jgi:hypothetical protein
MQPFLVLKRWVQGAADGDWHEVEGMLRPDEIADSHAGIHNGTVVTLRQNSSFLLTVSVDEYKRVLNAYYKITAGYKHGFVYWDGDKATLLNGVKTTKYYEGN